VNTFHFSANLCNNPPLTFDNETLKRWQSISFTEKSTTSTSAHLDININNNLELFRALHLHNSSLKSCAKNLSIIGYTTVSKFLTIKTFQENIHSLFAYLFIYLVFDPVS
jgi:hypothetical protein